MNQNNILIASLAIAAMAGGFWASDALKTKEASEAFQKAQLIQGRMLNPARKIALPELYKDDGSVLKSEDLSGRWTIMFFGYTHCPDICPTTMSVLAQTVKLAKQQLPITPQVYFVSVDPQRDKVEMLGEYVRFFDPDFRGITGDIKMLEALTLQTGVVFMKAPVSGSDENNYLVDHSASLLLMNPEGKLHAYLTPPHRPDIIIKSLKAMMVSGSAL